MIVLCKELGFKEPLWEVNDNTVKVTFPDIVVPFNYNEGISEGLNSTYIAVIEVLIKKGSLKVTQLADEIGKSAKTVERYVAFLKEIGAIEYEGSKKAGGYKVSDILLKRNND